MRRNGRPARPQKSLGVGDPGPKHPNRCWALVHEKGPRGRSRVRNCVHRIEPPKYTCLFHQDREQEARREAAQLEGLAGTRA